MSQSKIVVTGAGGFIGYNLANHLAQQGHEVVGLDRHFPANGDAVAPRRFEAVEGDFRDPGVTRSAMRGAKAVFHLAAAHLQKGTSDAVYWDVNVHKLPLLLNLAADAGVQRFVHFSSVGIYGQLERVPADEHTPARPQSIYGRTKLAGEQMLRRHASRIGLPTVVLRPGWVYGPGCPRTLKLSRMLAKRRFVMIGSGRNLRHPLYIGDMLQACELAMTRAEACGETLIIADDRPVTSLELIDTLCRQLDLPGPRVRLPYVAGRAMAVAAESTFAVLRREPPVSRRTLEFFDTDNAFDISRARRVLGFAPAWSLAQGLRATRAWIERVVQRRSRSGVLNTLQAVSQLRID
ncbi:MAG: NAD-dependent epimerase/dehydratase family protein [Phycisphaeraceae bacterium]